MQITLSFWLFAIAIIFNATGIESASPNSLSVANRIYQFPLPGKTYPVHYDLKLTTNVHVGETFFHGEVIIDIVVAKTTKSIYLHSHRNKIYWALIRNTLTGETELLSYKSNGYTEDLLVLQCKSGRKFDAGTRWKLTISYSGNLNQLNTKKGFYLFKYLDDKSDIHYLAATNFESAKARYAFPCYDEPHIRATFTITINHSPTYTAISNMPIQKALSSLTKTVFFPTNSMPTHLLYFAVTDFVYTEETTTNLATRICLLLSVKEQHAFALFMSRLVANFLTQYLNTEFATYHINYIAMPGTSKITKNDWGWKNYDKEEFIYTFIEPTMSIQLLKNTFIDIACEISNRLLGDYVTIKWWSYLWLWKGIVSLLSFRALDQNYSHWDVWQDFHTFYQNALESDTGNSTRPLKTDLLNMDEVDNVYDDVLYYKSPSVLFMWNEALTEKVFQKGLQNFLTQNKNHAVEEQQLYMAIQGAVEEEQLEIPAAISEMIGSWTRQSGYPTLIVTRNYNYGTFGAFVIKQNYYHDDQALENANIWYVPINYAVASDPNFHDTKATHYLTNAKEMIVYDIMISTQDWLILNKQSTGYYRINYDKENWDLIIEGLIEKPFKIHYRNRAQLLDDAFHFSNSNLLDQSIALKLLTYLKQENHYNAWYTAFGIITKYGKYLRAHEKFDDYRYFVGEIVSPIYKSLGVNINLDNHYGNKSTRNLIIDIACAFGVRECLEKTSMQIKDFLFKNISIETSIRDQIFSNGLRYTSNRVFNLLYQKLSKSADRDFRTRFSSYLSHTQTKRQMRKLMRRSIDKSEMMYSEERYTVLKQIYSKSELGLLTCIEFLNKNWDAYGSIQTPTSNPLVDDMLGMASFVVSRNAERQLLALADTVKNSFHVTFTLKKDLKEKISNGLKNMAKMLLIGFLNIDEIP